MPKRYLGDSVYADFNEAGQLVLTTENGFGSSNRIVVEYEVWLALMRFMTIDMSDKEEKGG